MILVIKPQTTESALEHMIQEIEHTGLHTHLSKGEEVTITLAGGSLIKINDMDIE